LSDIFEPAGKSGPTGFVPRILKQQSHYPNWLDYVGYGALHAGCLGALWTGCSRTDAIVFVVTYVARQFGLMGGYHRYFSHRSFKTSRAFQFVLALLGTIGIQKGVLWWASHHRHHHRYSDTPRDIFSPMHRGFFYAHSGWFLDVKNRDTDYTRVRDFLDYPEIVWLNEYNLLPVLVYGIALWALFGASGVVWGFCISTVVGWHALHAIGSIGHRAGGYRRFPTIDNSRNKWFISIALLGDGWHNNHHFYPASAKLGFVWWEYDPVYWMLVALSWIGLVSEVRVPPERLVRSAHSSQQIIQRFQAWVQEVRLSIVQRIEAEPTRQAIEGHLDAFESEATLLLLHRPEGLCGAFAALRRELQLELGPDASGLSIDADLAAQAARSPLAHLLVADPQLQGALA
jgi:stearoyl-CoA desaturase (delta-9 desaturase)